MSIPGAIMGAFVGGVVATIVDSLDVGERIVSTINGVSTTIGLYDGSGFEGRVVIPVYTLSPEAIFKGEVGLFNVDFFNVSDNEYVGTNIAQKIRPTISNWYNTLRTIATVAMMSILVYIGIKIVISSAAENKAKYKQLLMDWSVGMCLLFIMHYGMAFANLFVDKLTDAISSVTLQIQTSGIEYTDEIKKAIEDYNKDEDNKNNQLKIYDSTVEESDENKLEDADIILAKDQNGVKYITVFTDQMGLLRLEAEYARNANEGYLGATFLFLVEVILLAYFIWIYLKRVLYMAFLTLIAPFVAMTYPLDKIHDGQAQAFNFWTKEYFYNLMLQPLHLLLYTILVGSALQLASENILYSIVTLGFLTQAEKLLRQMFGFKGSTPPSVPSVAGGAMMMTGMRHLLGFGPKEEKDGGDRDKTSVPAKPPIGVMDNLANMVDNESENSTPDQVYRLGSRAIDQAVNSRDMDEVMQSESTTLLDLPHMQWPMGENVDMGNAEYGNEVEIQDTGNINFIGGTENQNSSIPKEFGWTEYSEPNENEIGNENMIHSVNFDGSEPFDIDEPETNRNITSDQNNYSPLLDANSYADFSEDGMSEIGQGNIRVSMSQQGDEDGASVNSQNQNEGNSSQTAESQQKDGRVTQTNRQQEEDNNYIKEGRMKSLQTINNYRKRHAYDKPAFSTRMRNGLYGGGRAVGEEAKRKVANTVKKVKPARFVAGALGAATAATIGAAIGVASGSPKDALTNASVAGLAGYKAGRGVGSVAGHIGTTAKEGFVNNYYTPEEREAQIRHKKYKDIMNDSNFVNTLNKNFTPEQLKELKKEITRERGTRNERKTSTLEELITRSGSRVPEAESVVAMGKMMLNPANSIQTVDQAISVYKTSERVGDFDKKDADETRRWEQQLENDFAKAGYNGKEGKKRVKNTRKLIDEYYSAKGKTRKY